MAKDTSGWKKSNYFGFALRETMATSEGGLIAQQDRCTTMQDAGDIVSTYFERQLLDTEKKKKQA